MVSEVQPFLESQFALRGDTDKGKKGAYGRHRSSRGSFIIHSLANLGLVLTSVWMSSSDRQ